MKKILLLVFSNLTNDARMLRHINFLSEKYKITVCCLGSDSSDEYETIIIQNSKLTFTRRAMAAVLLLAKRFSWAYRVLYPYKDQLLNQLRHESFDLIIANDIETLPLAFQLKGRNAKILFDAHEYAPRHFEDKLWWRVFFMDFNYFLCKEYIPLTNAMITISHSLADEYEKNFLVKPAVITNATHYRSLFPIKNNSNTIKLVHHGIVGRSRKIELIVNIMKFLPDHYTLDLVLVVPATASHQTVTYLEELKTILPEDKRIRFLDPVPTSQIVTMLQNYDMGIILAPPINFNYINGLPNKLFDFIQARIGVVSGPTAEIAKIINSYHVGVVSTGFTSESLAEKISSLTKEEIHYFKDNANKAAQELSADNNKIVYNNIVKSLIG